MRKQQVMYIVQAVVVIAALVLGFFGIALPITPEIPEPLTPEDVRSIALDVARDEVDSAMLATMGAPSLDFSAQSTACYREQGGAKWVCETGGEMEFQTGATLDVQSGATLNVDGTLSSAAGTFTVTDALAVTGLLYPSFTNETITNGETVTPTYTVYALDSAGAVTMTLAASAVEGQLLILIGDDANNVTVADTNLRSHDGAALVLGQYDVAMLVYQDAEWLQLVELANQ